LQKHGHSKHFKITASRYLGFGQPKVASFDPPKPKTLHGIEVDRMTRSIDVGLVTIRNFRKYEVGRQYIHLAMSYTLLFGEERSEEE